MHAWPIVCLVDTHSTLCGLEYWSAGESSGQPRGSATFDRPEPTAVISPVVNASSSSANLTVAFPRSTSFHQRTPYQRKSGHNSIETLREELQVIHNGITRVLAGLHLLNQRLLTYPLGVQYPWRVRTPIDPGMDTGPPHSAIEGPGTTVSAERPGSQDFSGYGSLNSQNFPQSTQSTQGGYYIGAPHSYLGVQEDSGANPYRGPVGPANFSYPNTNAQLPPFNSQPPAPSTTNAFVGPGSGETVESSRHGEESVNSINYDQGQYGNFGNRWQDYSQVELQRRSIAVSQTVPQVTAPSPFYVNGRPHQQVYAHPGPVLQHIGTQALTQPAYQVVSQAQINVPVPADTQHVSNVGVPPIYPQTLPRSNPYVQFPQSGVSSGGSQHRRHQRTQSHASNAGSSPGQNNSRFGTPNSRRRNRPSDDVGSHLARRLSSSQVPRTQAAATGRPDMPSTGAGDYYLPMLNAQQRAEIARRLQLGDLLRSMHSDEARALQIYEESLLHSRRYHQEFDTYEGSPPPKGLDDQNDGRPEPKETEEMTVNLECKICMSQVVDTVILPCGHAILCRWCADQHMPSSRVDRSRPKGHATCPMCRTPVKQKFRIFLS
ncbi:hypothetical protein ASPWEDRAFT_167592 [Aspergillus wentii DTO 134E9]|uniref:RING-type domain-containing protein n=1 Tax=Aspergillus wentii DTO 134E9 TaxID=1073089 RepID=A0A1L9S358_ASPWE|nr:uncharacterized protein ASPWEDRAFT_167592 [Aspergillus wentii DTO 134E9]OJJ41578.1 hypothetical protein ASPWEDRAFT_167592 [Aspergillus wentii DTO 134E9]